MVNKGIMLKLKSNGFQCITYEVFQYVSTQKEMTTYSTHYTDSQTPFVSDLLINGI